MAGPRHDVTRSVDGSRAGRFDEPFVFALLPPRSELRRQPIDRPGGRLELEAVEFDLVGAAQEFACELVDDLLMIIVDVVIKGGDVRLQPPVGQRRAVPLSGPLLRSG